MAKSIKPGADIRSLVPIYDLLADERERELLQSGLVSLDLNRGDKFITEGEPISCMHFLVEGKVKTYRNGITGRDYVVGLVPEGYFFGLRSCFSGEVSCYSAMACGPATVLSIQMSMIYRLLESNHRLALYFLKTLSDELNYQEARSISLLHKHLRGRLADTLLLLVEQYGFEEDGETLSLSLSRGDLAALSNMTTSNASRTLSLFASERIIALAGRKIKIINKVALERISRQG